MQNFYKTFKKILYAKAGFCRAQCKSLTQIIKDYTLRQWPDFGNSKCQSRQLQYTEYCTFDIQWNNFMNIINDWRCWYDICKYYKFIATIANKIYMTRQI